ncbi:MAG: beta-galactosidase [Frankiales bacterium]|nr:beta-galactosidase [Frankiales bacterium]
MPTSDAAVAVVPGRGLRLGETVLPMVSGAVHYWRHDPDDWPRLLDAVLALGVPMVETYIPWSVHEVSHGVFDFSGARDVERFLRLAAERGLQCIVRPGPHINAELPDFGFPSRVLWHSACQAHGPLGTPVIQHSRSGYFPCPSYGSPAFMTEVRTWYDAVLPRIVQLQWPDGPVVAVQVDNEMGYFFFVEPFVMDYRPEVVQDWHDWSGLAGDPPRDGRDEPQRVQSWVRHKEVTRLRALDTLAAAIRESGVHVPVFHNDFPHLGTPIDQATLEASGSIDVAANDLYTQREDVATAMQAGRTLAAASQLPYIAELGAGWVADCVGIPQRISPVDEEIAILALLLTGVRAWNWYMLAEREHWYGSPIDRFGHLREDEAALYPRLMRVLRELDWWSLERDASVLLLTDREVERWQAGRRTACEVNAVLDPLQLPPQLRVLEPDPQKPLLQAWRDRLEKAGLDFDEGSSDAEPPPGRYAVVLDMHTPVDAELPRSMYGLRAPHGVSLHRFTGGGREVLGVLNRASDSADVVITGLAGARLTGRWHPGSREVIADLDVVLAPHSAQLWEVTR